MPLFPRDKTDINSILNDPVPSPSRALSIVQPQAVIDEVFTSSLLHNIVRQTSGCSVEQLEQIYSALMNEIWKTRGDWNRGKVAREVEGVFADVMVDIHECQQVAARSMEIEGEEHLNENFPDTPRR